MLIYDFNEQADLKNIGIKAFNFRKLIENGLKIPKGFVVTRDFFRRMLEFNEIVSDFNNFVDEKKFENVKRLIANMNISNEFANELYKHYSALCYSENATASDLLKGCSVAVRASDESKKLDTFTNVKDKNELFKALKSCWQSYFSEETFNQNNSMALIVQKMLKTDKSGWVEIGEKVEVKAFWGQAGFIAKCYPDIYFVNMSDFSVLERKKGLQNKAFVLENNTYTEKLIPERYKSRYVLDEFELDKVLKIAKSIKEIFGNCSFEFGFSGDEVYVLNIRASAVVDEQTTVVLDSFSTTESHESAEEKQGTKEEEGNDVLDEDDSILNMYEETTKADVVEDSNSEPIREVQQEPVKEEKKGDVRVLNEIEEQFHQETDEEDVEEIINESEESELEAIKKIIDKYIIINPNLKDVFELLKKDIEDAVRWRESRTA